jgi:hypothetical protein
MERDNSVVAVTAVTVTAVAVAAWPRQVWRRRTRKAATCFFGQGSKGGMTVDFGQNKGGRKETVNVDKLCVKCRNAASVCVCVCVCVCVRARARSRVCVY